MGLIDSVDSAIKDENAPRLNLAVVPFRQCGSGVCSRLPIGALEGEPSSDVSTASSVLLPLETRVAVLEKGKRP
eukprot:323594-Pyramimonas_sp.AAC.1